MMANYTSFLTWNENRTDITFHQLDDPILPHLHATQLSWPLFVLAYGSIVLLGIYGYAKPNLFMQFLQSYSVLLAARILALYLTPLNPPEGIIILKDPLAPGASPLVRDLFFSGHTATTWMTMFSARGKMQGVLLMVACLTAIFVLVQKTHYSIDVYAAPFFSYGCYRVVFLLRDRLDMAYNKE